SECDPLLPYSQLYSTISSARSRIDVGTSMPSASAERRSLAVVPNIRGELPVVSDLLPHHQVFPCEFLRGWTFGLQTEGADLTRGRWAKRLDIEGHEFRISDLLRRAFPQRLDPGSTLHHCGTWWKDGRVLGVERGNAGEIALVEELDPLCVHRVNLGLLSEPRPNQGCN